MNPTVRPRLARGFLAHRGLIGLSAGCAMAEAALLGALVPAARGLAPQLTALPPLAVFHDLRWLYGYDPSWTGFGLLLAGMLTVRPALNAALIRLAWPAGLTPPRPREVVRAAVTFTVLTSLLLSPVVSLAFGVAILPFSWPFLATLPVMLLITLPLSHGGILGSWWRTLPPARAAGWLLADFGLLSVAAAVIGRLPWLAAVPVAGLAGLGNARGWYGLTSAVARRMPFTESLGSVPLDSVPLDSVPHRAAPVPLAPVTAVLAVAAVIGMTRLAFVVGAPARVAPPAAAVFPAGHSLVTGHRTAGAGAAAHDPANPGDPGDRARKARRPANPVLEIRGFGATCCRSVWDLKSIAPGALVQQFSYRGISTTGRPLPQGAAASGLPLPELGDRIAAQVAQLHRMTGRPVDIIAESEGTLGVDAMLAQHPGLPLGAVVMMSPIVAPIPAAQATAGGDDLVPGAELHAVVSFVGGLSPFGSTGAQTLISSVAAVGAKFAAAAARHHPVRWIMIVPLADAVTLPVCQLPPDVVVVPALHGDLLGDPAVKRLVRGFLADRLVPSPARYRTTAEILAAAGAAWRLPQTAPPAAQCGT